MGGGWELDNFPQVSFFSVASVFYLVAAVVSQYFLGDGPTSDDIWYATFLNPSSPQTI